MRRRRLWLWRERVVRDRPPSEKDSRPARTDEQIRWTPRSRRRSFAPMCNLYGITKGPWADPRLRPGDARHGGQTPADPRRLSRHRRCGTVVWNAGPSLRIGMSGIGWAELRMPTCAAFTSGQNWLTLSRGVRRRGPPTRRQGTGSMYERFSYAFSKTTTELNAVLVTDADYAVLQAYVLTVVSFGGIQFAIDHEGGSLIISFVTACVEATLFFLSVIGFIAFTGTLYAFIYNLAVGHEENCDKPGLDGWRRDWRVALSAVLSGFIIIAVISMFREGLSGIPIVGEQYATLL